MCFQSDPSGVGDHSDLLLSIVSEPDLTNVSVPRVLQSSSSHVLVGIMDETLFAFLFPVSFGSTQGCHTSPALPFPTLPCPALPFLSSACVCFVHSSLCSACPQLATGLYAPDEPTHWTSAAQHHSAGPAVPLGKCSVRSAVCV